MSKVIYILVLICSSLSLAAPEKVTVHQVINKYRNSPAVMMNLNKTVKMKLLGETQKSSGSLYLSSNKMRYEIKKPEKNLVVVNDKSIWIENRLPKNLGGKIQVTHLKTKTGQDKVKGFLAAFFGNRNIKDDMAFEKIDESNYKITFKKKSKIKDLKSAKIGIDQEGETITYLEYEDKISNITRHDFSGVNFQKSKDVSKFSYTPPKNADVTEM